MPESMPTGHLAAQAHGLVYVTDEMPGFSRIRRGSSFRYRDTEGRWLRDIDQIARIRQLAIPPAYTKVWICPLPHGHLQATGFDARGRKQYRYHAQWRTLKDDTKFERLEDFGRILPRIRARVARDLAPSPRAPLSRSVVLATLVRLLDTTFLRVGNAEYASSNGSYGLTTLRTRHARTRGTSITLRFRGKGGVPQEAKLDDPQVAKVVRRLQHLPGQELFQHLDEDGAPRTLSSTDVNDYLREASGGDFTAKDFRTWHGTVQALELTRLACATAPSDAARIDETTTGQRYGAKEIIGTVARQLGNTPAVCRKAYIHPAVLALGAALADDVEALQATWAELAGHTARRNRLQMAESRLLVFLRRHRLQGRRRAGTVGATEMARGRSSHRPATR